MARTPKKVAAKAKPAKKPARKTRAPALTSAASYLDQLKKLKEVDAADFGMLDDGMILPPVEEVIPTSNLAIDRLIGGGWPVGRITEVAAWEGVGKSTLIDQSIAQVQRMGGIGCIIDTECARTPSYTASLGVKIGDLLAIRARTVEEVFAAIERVLEVQEVAAKSAKGSPPPLLLCWDSVGGTATEAELAGEAGDQHMASAAKVIRRNLRRLSQRLAPLRTALVLSNQFYKSIGGFGGGGGNIAYGGKGIAYHASLRLWLARTGALKLSDGTVIGQEVEAKIKKTRIGMPRPPVKTALIFGGGFDNAYALFQWGKDSLNPDGAPWIQQKGAHCWLYPEGEAPIHFQRTFYGLGQLLTEQPDTYRAMATQFTENHDG